jgi:transcriptional regulator with XRE-family HTH domain
MDTQFKEVMKAEGIRVGELAEKAGVSTKTVSKLRNSIKHGVEETTVNRVAKAFNALAGTAYTREEFGL